MHVCVFFFSFFFLQDSQGEWFDADFVNDARNNFTTSEFVKKKLIPQRLDLVHRYPKAMLWHTDGGWMAPDQYWNNLDWLTYLCVLGTQSPLSQSSNLSGCPCMATPESIVLLSRVY
jgi:hypothetical protein